MRRPGYAEKTASHLTKLTGKPYYKAGDLIADDLITGTWDQHAFVAESGAIRSLAVKPSKIASDMNLLSSGPRAGRDQSATGTAGLVHHAGQGQPGHARAG